MATPTSPIDTDISECELASCSTDTTITTITTASFTPTKATPASLVSMASLGTDEDEEEEAVLVSGYGAAASGALVSMEQEFEALDAGNGWPQAYLEVADLCHDYPYHVARALENRSRNRYEDVSPYDHSRVRLKAATPAPGGGFHPGLGLALAIMAGGSCSSSLASSSTSSAFSSTEGQGECGGGHLNDYINASLVVVEGAQRSYILTQGPLPNTCGHFWLMVWQQDSKAVIMLNQLVEKDSIKCSQYWPPYQGQTLLFEEIGIRVHMLGEEGKPYHTVHYLRLENILTGEMRPISHFHYTSWPDRGVPESPASFLAFLFMVRESGSLNYEQGPVVIHCSAGIGRSGTFALIDACLVLMENKLNPFSLNIRQVLVGMRKYRMGLIQTPEQLRFSYMAVIEGAKFLMGDENIEKKWEQLTSVSVGQGPSYDYDNLPPQKHREFRLVLQSDKIQRGRGFSGLATRMPNSGEGSSESPRKRLGEDINTSIGEEVLQNREKTYHVERKKAKSSERVRPSETDFEKD